MRKLLSLITLLALFGFEATSQVSVVLPKNGGTGLTTYTVGDIIYASAPTVFSRRAIGSAGDVLVVSGGVPTWTATPPFASNFWKLDGNTNGSLKYIGTNDNYPFPIRVNSSECFRIVSRGHTSSPWQVSNGTSISFGSNNGFDSTIAHNVVFGYQCLGGNGEQPGYPRTLTTGEKNSLFGPLVGFHLSSGSNNSNFGCESGEFYETATNNAGFGFHTLNGNKHSYQNTAVGAGAMQGQYRDSSGILVSCWTFPVNSTAVGYNALSIDTTFEANDAFGSLSLEKLESGNTNAGFGQNSLGRIVGGTNNTGIGGNAGALLKGSPVGNTLIGTLAGYGDNTNTFSYNTILGTSGGQGLTTGSSNIIIGYQANANIWSTESNRLWIDVGNNVIPTIYGDLSTQRIGLGTISPDARLHVVGQVKIVDGFQAAGYVLTSDVNGLGKWVAGTAIFDSTHCYTKLKTDTVEACSPLYLKASTVTTSSNVAINGVVTAGTWSATPIANAYLANSTISGISLGSNLNSNTPAYGISGTAFNGSAAVSNWKVDTTAIASKLYVNAKTAITTFTINGTGMALGTSSTVTAEAGTLTGTTLNATVVNSSLTSLGTSPTFTTPVFSGIATGTYTLGGTPTLSGATISTSTISAPVLSGSATGTYTLAGTQTISNPTITLNNSSPTVNGSIGYAQSTKVLNVGDGSVSQSISLGAWTSYTPTVTGYTVSPAPTFTCSYSVIGKTCFVDIIISGTSSTTAFTYTLPFAAKNAVTYFGHGQDVGVDGNSAHFTVAGSTTVNVYKSNALLAWTGSGTKSCNVSYSYQLN